MIRFFLAFILILGLDIPEEDVMYGFILFVVLLTIMLSGLHTMQEEGIIGKEDVRKTSRNN